MLVLAVGIGCVMVLVTAEEIVGEADIILSVADNFVQIEGDTLAAEGVQTFGADNGLDPLGSRYGSLLIAKRGLKMIFFSSSWLNFYVIQKVGAVARIFLNSSSLATFRRKSKFNLLQIVIQARRKSIFQPKLT